MTARILDGKATAAAIRADVKQGRETRSVSLCHVATKKRASLRTNLVEAAERAAPSM